MDDKMIRRVTRDVISKYSGDGKQSQPPTKILAIFMGGNREVDIALQEVKKLSLAGFDITALLTKSAQRVIGETKVKSTGVSKIVLDNGQQNSLELAKGCDLLLIPVLTLTGLSKIAQLIADSLSVNIIIQVLRRKIPVIAASDSVVSRDLPDLPASSGLMRKIGEYINQLRNYGIKVTVAKNLNREVCEAVGGKIVNVELTKQGDICTLNGDQCVGRGLCVVKKEDSVKTIIEAGATRIGAKPGIERVDSQIARMIDHTLLKPDATQEQIGKLCEEAKKFHFATVCVNPANVSLAAKLLKGSDVGVAVVVGFPLGATTSIIKAMEARDAIANGATEIDMVINIGALKSGNYELVLNDIKAVREATRGYILKTILETSLLTDEEIVKACQLAKEAGADFVKTSTGFGSGGATVKVVRLMRETVGPAMGVKAAGGIHTQEEARQMIEAGATRIGASAGVAIATGK